RQGQQQFRLLRSLIPQAGNLCHSPKAEDVDALVLDQSSAQRTAAEESQRGEQASHREEVCKASMKKEEARRAVLSEYDRWAKKHPNDARMMGGFLFFRYLQKERSDLLDFRPAGDKRQIVHGWLRDRLED